jgi:predicted acylesterase/phospholipase RssA
VPKRVAITIAGAVSLGSYEAGVTFELLEALRAHNEAATDPDKKIYVDVITGASAGGMTAAMLAEWLMFDGDSMHTADGNPLYHAWVERISLKGLVLLQWDENKWHSLFSSNLVAAIGKEMLVDWMKRPNLRGPHACLEPGAPLRVGVALTNLNGIDYMIPIVGSDEGGFNYTRSADQQLFLVKAGDKTGPVVVTADMKEKPSTWESLRDAAVGSGAFPFAFRPRGILRSQMEFVNTMTPLWPGIGKPTVEGTTYVEWGANEPSAFAYSDGGVLQNQPLGIAKKLVNAVVTDHLAVAKTLVAEASAVHLDVARSKSMRATAEHVEKTAHQDADDRLYVFVSPNEVKSSAEDLVADNISLRTILPRLLHTYMRQATFHDWIMAESVNQKVRLLDDRAKELADALSNGSVEDLKSLQVASGNLNHLLLGVHEAETLVRLRHQYDALYAPLQAKSQELADTFVSAIATLEAAAQLADSDKMHIVAVLADGAKELAGSGMAAFVGFFSRKFREHDYLVGRVKARAYLQRTDVQGILHLNMTAVEAGWQPLPDPAAMVKVPLSLPKMLAPGIVWLLWLVVLRVWIPLLVLVTYGVAANLLHWWPFR